MGQDVATEFEHVEQTLRECVASLILTDEQPATLKAEDDLLGGGLIDSMGVMEIVAFVEQTFGIVVDDTEIVPDNFRSIWDMSSYVASKTNIPVPEIPGTRNLRGLVGENVPSGAVVLVTNAGDERLLDFPAQTGRPFPQDSSGACASWNPADSADAIAQLKTLEAQGATHIAFPTSSLWWLDSYTGMREYLESSGQVARNEAGVVYALG